MKSPPLPMLALLLTLATVLGCDGGCGRKSSGSRSSGAAGPGSANSVETALRWRGELFTYAVDNLNRLEEFDTSEMYLEILRRGDQVMQHAGAWDPKTDSLAMTWPEPDMLRRVVNRLNQWVSTQEPPADWKLDPLVAQLPPSLREVPPLEDAAALEFSSYDGFMLEEAVWLSNLSDWARGKSLDDLDRARRLFDWTVRNIQLDPHSVDRTPLLPREVLLLGHGSAMERAWVFILLARQQGLDAAVLAVDRGAATRKAAAGKKDARAAASAATVPLVDLSPWCVTVLADGKLYLFDPVLAVPIPAPGPVAVDRGGQLDLRPATLAEVRADDRLLRRLDLGPTQPYPVKSADLKHVVLLVEGSPQYLAKRRKLLESHLAGKQKIVLTAMPAAQAERLKQAAGPDAAAQLWVLPYETLHRRLRLGPQGIVTQLMALLPLYAIPSSPLYHGRVLHLKGRFEGQRGAIVFYQEARPSNQNLADRFQAILSDVGKKPKEQQPVVFGIAELNRQACLLGKQDASYWLGLIAFEQGNDASAIAYFDKRTLQAVVNSPWGAGASYNLARAYEAAGQPKQAIAWYQRAEALSPGSYGSLLRANWLKKD